jgi:hypothetical protein
VNSFSETSDSQKTEQAKDIWVISPKEMLVLFQSTYMGYDVKYTEELVRCAEMFNTINFNNDFKPALKHHKFFSLCLELANNHWTTDQVRDFVFELDSDEHRYKISSLISYVVVKEFFLNLKKKVKTSGELSLFPKWFENLK